MSGKGKRNGRNSSAHSKATRSLRQRSCLTEALEPRRLFATVVWTGSGDGTNWTDPNNWSTHALPGSGDDAVVNTSGGAIALAGTETVRSLNTVRAFTIASGSLSLAGGTGSPTTAFGNACNISAGATLTIASNVKVIINGNETLTDNGTMTLATGDVFTLTAYNYAPTQIVVNGLLAITGATVTQNQGGGYPDNVVVNPGGHLIANNSTFSTNSMTISAGAVFNSGDLSNDSFSMPIYLPGSDVALLSAAGGGADNKSFQDLYITSSNVASGSLNLNAIGTASTSSLLYVFPGSFNISAGATLAVGSGVSILMNGNETMTDNGTMSLSAGDVFTLTAYNYAPTQIVVNGLLTVTNATITQNQGGGYPDNVVVDPGGHLVAVNSVFSTNSMTISAGAVFNAGDLSNDSFSMPIYLPGSDVALLSSAGGGADNKSFQDLYITSSNLASGSLNLNAIGTASTSSLLYIFPSSFNISAGATLAAGPGVSVLMVGNETLTDNGTISLTTGDVFTLTAYNYAPTQIVVNGLMTVTGATITQNQGGGYPDNVLVNPGGHLIATNSTFSTNSMTISAGAVFNSGDLSNDSFSMPIYLPGSDVALLSAAGGGADNKSFQDLYITSANLPSGSLNLNAIGTASTSSLLYIFPGSFNISAGATLAVGSGVSVLMVGNETMTDNGTMTLAAGDVLTLTAYNYAPTQIVVNGLLTVAGATITQNQGGGYPDNVVVDPGGHLIATNSTFSTNSMTISAGAVFNSGDLSNDSFNMPIYLPGSDIALLSASGGGADNKSFQDLDITSSNLPSGSLNLNKIGTASTSSLRYIFPGSFNISTGATLAVGSGVPVLMLGNETLTDNGTMTLSAGDVVTLTAYNYAPTQIVVNGLLTVTGATITQNQGGGYPDNVLVNPGGHLIATNSTFSTNSMTLSAGAVFNSGDLSNDSFSMPIYLPAGDIALLSAAGGGADNKSFQDLYITSANLPSGSLNLNAIGTTSTSSLLYIFPSSFNISAGATLAVGSGVPVTMLGNETMTDNGTMTLSAGDVFTLTAYNYAPTQIVVNGLLMVTGATITQNQGGGYPDNVVINPGGHLVAINTAFSTNSMTINAGAVFNSGDLANNSFSMPLYLPIADVPLLSAATGGADNKSFQNIEILGGNLSSGTVNLNAIGTVSTSSLLYVFPSSFNISTGAMLAVGSGVPVTMLGNETMTDNGTMTLAAGDVFTLTAYNYAPTQIVVNGLLTVTGATITQNQGGGYPDNVVVNPGGQVNGVNSNFTMNSLVLNNGSAGVLNFSQIGKTYYIGSGGAGLTLTGNDFFNIQNGASLIIPESLQINTSGVALVTSSSSLTVDGNLLGNTQSPAAFNPAGTVTLNGTATATAPELLEAMGADVGNASTGFVNNFAYGTLILSSKTYVKLVDQSHNTTSTSSEAVYVNSLIVPVGATLNLNGLHLYARDAQIGGTVTGGTINQIPNSGPLAVDSPAPGKISTSGELDDWTFYDTAGDTVAVSVDPGSGLAGGPISPVLGYAQVQLLDPSGTVIATGSSTTAGGVVNLTNVNLTSSGTYTVAVKAASSNASNTGDYVVAAYDVTSSVQSLNLNQPQTGTLPTPFSVDHWSFSAVAGTQVQFVLTGESASGLQFSLTGPSGFVGFNNATGSSALINLPTAGTYTFTAQGTGGAIGSYAFQLNQTNVQPLTLGVTSNGAFAGSGQAQLYSAVVTAADPLSISLSDPSTADHVELYASLGTPPTRQNYQYAANGGGSNQSIFVPDADPGTWYFLVYAESVAGPPSSYSIQAHTSEIILSSATPNMGVATALTTLTIGGDGFNTGTTVSLLSASNVVYPATTSVLNLPTQMTATFKAGSVPAGTYSIKVTQADGVSAILSGVFTMAATGQGVLTTNLELPNPMSRHIAETIYVDYSNTGTAAMPAPLLILGATNPLGQDGALMTLDPALQGEGLWTNNTPAGYSQSIEILASGATPGVLQPGESERIPVYYAGWLTSQWDFSAPTLNFSLKVVQPTDQSAMNWNGVTYVTGTQTSKYLLGFLVATSTSGFAAAVPWVNGVPPTASQIVTELDNGIVPIEYPQGYGPLPGETTISFSCTIATTDNEQGIAEQPPATIPATAWNIISSNLQSAFGSTLGGYVEALDSEANYLGQLGEDVTDVQSLWGFAVQQADNALSPLSPYLASATDDSVAMPGSLSLDFSRVFAESISGRDTVSTLGTGWSNPWQTTAVLNSDGSVTITGPAGGQQLFEPDDRTAGVYFSQPGDTSTLTGDGSGGYLLTASDGTQTDYTSAGFLNYMQDTNGNRITAGYTSGKLTSLNASTGQYIHIGYNSSGLIATLNDSTGRSVAYTYDASNTYLTSVRGYSGQSTVYGYNTTAGAAAQNALTSITFPGSTHQYFTYDTQGRIASTYSDGGAEPQTFTYNLGQVTVTDGTTDTSSVYYNENGQVAKSVDGLGNPTFYTYDGDYNLKTVTNAQGAYETYTYNSAGEATSSTDFLGNTTQFVYGGPHNELTSMTDAKGNVTQYGYDASGDLLSTTYADSTHSNSTFNPLGEATSFINQNGQPINYTYNAAGQVATESFSDGSSYAYTYNAYGNLLTATDATGVTSFTYDPTTELMTQVTYPGGLYLKFTYNAAGQRTQMVDQTGFTTNYIYDSDGRLSQLTDGSGNVIVTYTYDADGRLSKKVNGNGTYTTYTYDADGNVLTLFNYAPGGAVNSSFVYSYNSLGLETTETTIDGQWVYGYDADGQLTHAVFTPNATDPDGLTTQNEVYNYDAMGNRTSTIINGVTTVYVTNNMNEYTSVGGVAYTYDGDGNLLNDGFLSYTYSSLNLLTGETGQGENQMFVYNAVGERSETFTNGIETLNVLDPNDLKELASDYTSAGVVETEYVYGLGLVASMTRNQETYLDFDAMGSTSELTNSGGSIIDNYSYEPFGNLLHTGNSDLNRFDFLSESGAVTLDNGSVLTPTRLLNVRQGRFTSTDPLHLNAPNAYSYATNNPVIIEDSTGLDPNFGPTALEPEFWNSCPLYGTVSQGSTIWYGNYLGPGNNGYDQLPINSLDAAAREHDLAYEAAGASGPMDAAFNPSLAGADATFAVSAWGSFFFDGSLSPSSRAVAFGSATVFSTITVAKSFVIVIDVSADEIGKEIDSVAELIKALKAYTVSVIDPNALYGPSGSGTSNFVAASDTSYPYLVDFENSPTATAPVQYLTVTDQLDPNLNWSTFQLTGIGWGNFYLTIPAGSQTYQTTVLMTENEQTFDVEVNAGIHTSTGQVYATFQCIDPATGLPPSNPLTGFLPPESGTGNGSGYLKYTISPKANLPTGTQIRNVASINFDQGLSIATDEVNDENLSLGIDPTKQALVTIDAGDPTSSVTALPPTENTANFNVSWGGMDDTGGSGIATYTIYVSANGTPFLPWLINTNTTSGTFAGTPGNAYSFYSVATDNVGNVQPTPTGGQATTMVSGTAPQTLTLTGSVEYLQLDADGTHLDVWNSTSPTGSPTQYLLSSFSSIIVSGAATGTSLTIDFTNGDPLVASGLTFAGVAGKTNTLNVIGTSGNDNVAVNGTSIIEAAAFGSASILYSNLSAITFNGGSGNDSLTQTAQPGAPVSFLGTTFSDTLSVNAGTFTFPASSASTGIAQIDLGNLSIGAAAKVGVAPSVSHANRSVLVLNSLSLAGNAGSWTGTLDLADNDLILNGGTLATVVSQIQGGLGSGNWKGVGLTSSNAANDSTHLTALGVLLNTNGVGGPLYGGGTTSGLFDGVNPSATAILVKYTYYGDTNLDGAVDGSDYSRIDSGFLNHLTGWYNGDLNYSGALDGTDYTLIDNTFNSQGSRLSNLTPTLTLPAAPLLTYDGTSDVTNWVIATLSGPAGDPTPTGTVTIQYFNGSSATGAALPSAPITPGTYTVIANYAGDTHYAAELSNAVTFTINKAQATVTLAAGPGTIKYDGTTDVTNWVKGFATGQFGAALATGAVTPVYYSGTSAAGTPLSSSPVNSGTYTVVGSYSGDSNYAASLSAPITFTISATSGAQPLMLTGPAFYLRLDADGQHMDVWNSTSDIGSPAQSVLLSTISSIAIAGVSAGTTLSVDFAAGDPLVPSGLNFNGVAGANNVLKVIDSGDASASSFTVDAVNVMVTVPSGIAPIGYANAKAIGVYAGTGAETLTQNAQPGNGATSLSYLNTTASDNLVLNTGTFTFAGSVAGAGITSITLGNVSIKSGTTLTVAAPDVHADRYVMTFGSLFIAGSTNAWLGQLNLTGNDLIVHNGSLSQLTNQIASGYANGTWTGQGITSSTAATASGHQTALGIEANNNGSGQPLFGNGAPLGLFDGQNPSITDLLIKYTYYGDANLDGKVDGSDYARIDSGILNHATGWSNGDFNYDAVVNGSDYTLIDNDFNSQGASLAASVAVLTAKVIRSSSSAGKSASESWTASGPNSVFSSGRPLTLPGSATEGAEMLLRKKDFLEMILLAE